MEPILRENPILFEPWMAGVFLISLGALAYIRMVYSKRFGLLFKTAARLQILRQVMREELLFSHRASLVLFAHFVVMASLIIYAAFNFYGVVDEESIGISLYLIVFFGLLLLYLLKFLFMGVLRWVYQDKGLLREYRFEVFSVSKILGIIYLPLALISVSVNVGKLEWVFPLAALLFGVSFVFRAVQGLAMSFSYNVSRIYIILYLCTLEILPFVLFLSLFNKSFA
ncbi:MAG: hypothetical protein ACI8QH_001521 [Flammeovirgaceae bacterium]|jgi:hypothetical protein